MIPVSEFYAKVKRRGWFAGSLLIRDRHIEVSRQQIESACGQIEEYLRIYRSNFPAIISTISPLRFPSMIQLALQDNKIESIEALPLIFMPQLKSLRLSNNKITTVRAIRKCYWPNLKVIKVNENHIMDAQYFAQVRMSEGFECLDLSKNGQPNLIVKDVNWIAKIEPQQIYRIRYTNKRTSSYDDGDHMRQKLYDIISDKLENMSRKFKIKNNIIQ